MKNLTKKVLAVLLTLAILSGMFVCAAELNQEAVNKHKGQFKNYVLLGDSVASGYRDEITENDELFNEQNQESTYYRVPGSYADVLTKAIIEDDTMIAFAGPGFRTIEIRYMLEDDFNKGDDYLFHPSHLDVVGYAGSEEFRTAYKKAVAEADLITLGVGGNDWGAYLGGVVADVIEKTNAADEYIAKAKEILENSEMDMAMVEQLVEIAHIAGALPELLKTIPEALQYGLGNFYKNWDIMIQDIYDLNPDVTLMVLGMSDNSVKGKYYDYDGVKGEPVNGDAEENAALTEAMSVIIDFIMTVGNTPMIEGAEKFGYTYVDTAGTTYVDSHPDADGHVYIANKIIEALPDPELFNKFEDIQPGHKYYNAVEYVLKNGIMSATSDTTFSPDAALTQAQLDAALENIAGGSAEIGDNSSEVSTLSFAITLFSEANSSFNFVRFFKSIGLFFDIISSKGFNFGSSVTRAEAAAFFADYCNL